MKNQKSRSIDRQAQDLGIILERVSGEWYWRPAENWQYDYAEGAGSTSKTEALNAYRQYQSEMI